MGTLSINVQKMHHLFKSKGEGIPQGIWLSVLDGSCKPQEQESSWTPQGFDHFLLITETYETIQLWTWLIHKSSLKNLIHRKNSKIEGSQNSTNEEFVYHKVENITDKRVRKCRSNNKKWWENIFRIRLTLAKWAKLL